MDRVDKSIQSVVDEPTDLERLRQISDQLIEPELAIHIIENHPSAIVITKRDAVIFYANREAEFLFKYARHEMIGHHIEMLIPAQYRDRHDRLFHNWLERPVIRAFPNSIETVAMDKNGEIFGVMIALLPVVISAGFFVCATIRKK